MSISVTFTVNTSTALHETVCLVGSSPQLGSWNPLNAVQLHESEHDKWTCCVTLDSGNAYSYRYFVARRQAKSLSAYNGAECNTSTSFDVVRWETHSEPRYFETTLNGHEQSLALPCANFGEIDGICSESRGWLMQDICEVHIRLHGNPIKLMRPGEETSDRYIVGCFPMDFSKNQPFEEASSLTGNVLVSNLACKNSCPCPQDARGVKMGPQDFIVFRYRTPNLQYLGFLLEVSMCNDDDEGERKIIGSAHLLPENIPKSQHEISLSVIGRDAMLCGSIKVDVLIGRPTPNMTFDMKSCDQSYWKWRSSCETSIDVGHRGMGGSFSETNLFKENTVASFNAAQKFGAHFIETDILLTKDLVPVIFHDFSATTALKNTRDCQSVNDLHVSPIHDLTMEQIRCKKFFTSKGVEINDEDPPLDKKMAPFPTLAEILSMVDPGVGFDLEVKFPQMQMSGEMEAEAKIDKNTYIDAILKVIYQHAGDRRIFFSTFEPDICVLLKLKQNRYPVTFLSQGETKIYTNFLDFRSSTFSNAINFAISEGILGLVLHTEVLFRDMSIIEEVLSQKLILFVWGVHNNDPEVIKQMRKLKVDGVIYDRIDLNSPENAKNSLKSNEDGTDHGNHNNSNSNPSSRRQTSGDGENGGSPKKQQRY